ncbi:PREDICTED: uncharacterized protein LOC106741535 [Dinoponera quadriceps]|uniref:Uncharacterized protein LOC106741535 n=1 Tax=Dinoponera quadriceps TaxID=609295 RepID=A0A6P3WU13_DINQU|nr:PREDICTED: uncharacterized protein LOC106741535 [Dinoponera quadriceps]
MEDQNRDPCVALILKDSRLLVNRKQLISKSQYFAMLLSESYIDHLQQEHVINYDISISTLQDYINWIHDEDFCMKFDFVCKTSLEKHCNPNSYEDLVKLLDLSVLFLTDLLTDEITNIMEAILVIPELLIDIWLVARDLGLSTLQDIFFAACLDYFDKLPIDKLLHLESQNLQKLLNNENISSTEENMWNILFMWVKANKIEELPTKIPILIKDKKPKVLNCIIDYEKPQNYNSKIFLYCWDGRNFFKYSTLTYPKEITNARHPLIGMQFTGRRYDLYMCGGEYGVGRGKFNEKIWHYSLISKKWIFETRMPRPRRNMITVLFKNKLYLIGGVGEYRTQLKSVNIYDIHSRIWTKGSQIPASFSGIPEYCVDDDKLIIYMTQLHVLIYYSKDDTWTHFKLLCDKSLSQEIILMGLDESACFLDVINKDATDDIVLRCMKYETGSTKCLKNDTDYTCEERSILLGPQFRLGHHKDFCSIDTFLIQCRNSDNIYVWLRQNYSLRYNAVYNNFHVHTVPIQESIKFNSLFYNHTTTLFSSTTKKFFRLMDTADLHSGSTTIT